MADLNFDYIKLAIFMKNRWKQRHSGDYIRIISDYLHDNDIKNEKAHELFNKLVELEVVVRRYPDHPWPALKSIYHMHNFSRTLAKRSKY